MPPIRPTAVAGSFYPADLQELNELVYDCLNLNPFGPLGTVTPSTSLIGGMVPHAGYIYSGPCAAHFYALLATSALRVILLGVNHSARGHHASLSPWSSWETPLGKISVDEALQQLLRARVDFLKSDERAHADEHSIEVQLPFLQRLLSDFSFLPISLSYLSIKDCDALGSAIAEVCGGATSGQQRTIILASSDLSHYLGPEETDEHDFLVLEKVLAIDPQGLLRVVEEQNITMCGVIPTAVMLFAAAKLGIKRARLLKHYHSGQVTAMKKVVGYASIALES